jgi:hypothetical protein
MGMKRTFFGLDVARHPWLAGQLWAALFCPTMIVIELLRGHPLPLAAVPALIGLCVLGGVAFGAGMSILAKSAANRGEG